jgi:hypothetical protein
MAPELSTFTNSECAMYAYDAARYAQANADRVLMEAKCGYGVPHADRVAAILYGHCERRLTDAYSRYRTAPNVPRETDARPAHLPS